MNSNDFQNRSLNEFDNLKSKSEKSEEVERVKGKRVKAIWVVKVGKRFFETFLAMMNVWNILTFWFYFWHEDDFWFAALLSIWKELTVLLESSEEVWTIFKM